MKDSIKKYFDLIKARTFHLKYGWILFIICLIIYTIYNSIYYNNLVFQLSSTLITIFLLTLAMYTSNKELHKASFKEITAFENSIRQVTITIDEVKDFIKAEIAKREALEVESKKRAMPIISVLTEARQTMFFTHGFLTVINSGGHAYNIEIYIHNKSTPIKITGLGRNMQFGQIDCGRDIVLGNIENVAIKVFLNDGLTRHYFFQGNINFRNNVAVNLPLSEIS